MVRTYKRKTNRAEYGSEALVTALGALDAGESVKNVSRIYGIPPKTLRRHRDKKVKSPGEVCMGAKTAVFTAAQEADLVTHIQEMERSFFGMSTTDVRKLAYQLAKHLGVSGIFSNASEIAGRDWLAGFMKRHPTLSIRSPQATSLSRAVSFNKPTVMNFFGLYQNIVTANNLNATKIWNVDESGISTVQRPMKIVASKGARNVGRVTSGERGKNVTVICAMNSAGTFIPPLFVFPRKRMIEALMKDSPAGSIAACSDNGWSDGNIFLKWLAHFADTIKCSKEDPHLLLLDGHVSHKTLDAVLFARERGIVMLSFPPHCTHRMQPLDRAFFKSLKNNYNATCDNWMTSHPGKRISFFDIAGIFTKAYNRSACIEKAVNGFEACGLWPFNDSIFTDADFAPSLVTAEPEPSTSNAGNAAQRCLSFKFHP